MRAAAMQLQALYARRLPRAEMLRQKWELIANVQQELGFRRRINNATFMQFLTYETGTAAFARLLEHCGGDHTRLLRFLKAHAAGALKRSQETQLDGPLDGLRIKLPCP